MRIPEADRRIIALAVPSLLAGWGIVGVWLALVALIAARCVFNGARFLGEGWTSA